MRPLVEYAVPVRTAGLTLIQTNLLERIQNRALRVKICFKFASDMYKSESFKTWFPQQVKNKVQYSPRNGDKIQQVKCKTNRYKNSAIPYFINLLNNIYE